jgi:hypothetical protein
MPVVYAFDVDDTLEISGGPIPLQTIIELRVAGHIIGLCGNWAVLTRSYPGWHHLVSFMNVAINKEELLSHLKEHVPADDYVMVGNILGVSGASDDQGAAQRAGWRFIKESDFAAGAR